MRSSSWVKDAFLNLRAELKHQQAGNRVNQVRMVWQIDNISDKRIRIRSYYAPFYIGPTKWGVFTQGRWVKERFEISNDHIRTYLYPEEKRSVVWSWVTPSYYGLKGMKPWHYRLEINYTINGDPEKRKIVSSSNPLRLDEIRSELPDKLGPFTSSEVIYPLLRTFPTITDEFEERRQIERELVPFGRAAIVPDAVLRTDNELVVVQLATYVSRQDLQRMNQAVANVNRWAQQLGLSVVGIIMAIEYDDHIRRIAKKEYPRVRILRMEIENRNVR